jgi:hypothetical protein
MTSTLIKLDQLTVADVRLLPASVQDLVKVIGLTATLALVNQYGGTTLLIPQGKTRAGEQLFAKLAETIGEPEMAKLAEHCRDREPIYIPFCEAALRIVRDRLIRRDFDAYTVEYSANKAVAKLARAHGISDRRIWIILKSIESIPDQMQQQALFA